MKKPLTVAMCLMLASFMVQAADTSVGGSHMATDHVKANNTEVNKRDRNEQTLTPIDQSNTKADLDITQAIRKSIMKHELSTNAKNIKVITQNGEVTLRGPVDSKSEIKKIVKMTKSVPGIRTVNNQLEVK